MIMEVAADYHFSDSKMMLNWDAAAAVQNCCCHLRGKVLERERVVVPHAPYLPYWPLPVQRPAVVSICFVDSETIFSLVFRWVVMMLLNQRVPMNSGTWTITQTPINQYRPICTKMWGKRQANENVTFLNRTSIPIEKLVHARRRFAFSFFASIAWNRLHLAIHCPMAVRDSLGHRPQLFPGHRRPNRLTCSCMTNDREVNASLPMLADSPTAMHFPSYLWMSYLLDGKRKKKCG